jgi:hypothetical protein
MDMPRPKYCGPGIGVCAVCGLTIEENESRFYGSSGAVHYWQPGGIANKGVCRNGENKQEYPHSWKPKGEE